MKSVKRIVKRILKGPFFNITYYYKMDQDSSKIFAPYLNLKSCEYEILTKEKCYQVMEIREKNVEKTFEEICDTQIVLLAKYDGKIAGHAVLKFSKDNYLGKHWFDDAYIHYCFVSPAYRGKNIYPYMMANLSDIAFKQYEIKEIYGGANKNNISSQKGIQKVGYKKIETGFEIGWGGISLFEFWKMDRK